jgi:uncharacterized membrane protein YbhN (UPF0104 family)
MPAKKYIIFFSKFFFIATAFTIIFLSADTKLIIQHITHIPIINILISCLILLFAQIISAYRMQYYFKTKNLVLSNKFSIALYLTTMLYNTILPGGISGDGYKIYLLGKLANFAKLESLRVILSERANGLFVLLNLTLFLLLINNISLGMKFTKLLIFILILLNILVYCLSIKTFLNERVKVAIGALPYSLSVQFMNVSIIIIILYGLGFDINNYEQLNSYVILFLVSCILSVLPISIGGVGIRELTFMYGSSILSLNSEIGISIAVIYFLVNMICSLTGFIFWHKLEKIYLKL